MSGREAILSRIKEALTAKTRRTHAHASPPQQDPQADDLRAWLPPGGESQSEGWSLFCENARKLKVEVQATQEKTEVIEHLKRMAREEGWTGIASHSGSLTTPACQALDLPVCWTQSGYRISDLEASDAAITECEALVAQTGSILVSAASAGGRALSVLPPHHVVLATRSQLIPDLAAAFSLLREKYGENYPSFLSFITGPSRTGDIERILVLGAHGPRRLTLLCSSH